MAKCPTHKRRLTWNSVKGFYCWPCENRARQATCRHRYSDKRHMGIVGYRHFCGQCGAMYVGLVDEFGDPLLQEA